MFFPDDGSKSKKRHHDEALIFHHFMQLFHREGDIGLPLKSRKWLISP